MKVFRNDKNKNVGFSGEFDNYQDYSNPPAIAQDRIDQGEDTGNVFQSVMSNYFGGFSEKLNSEPKEDVSAKNSQTQTQV